MTNQTQMKPTLTTDHPASSYGQPVYLYDNVAYGAGDLVFIGGGKYATARDLVDFFLSDFVDRGQGDLAKKFIS